MLSEPEPPTPLATFEELFAYHDEHKRWPTTADPHFGSLVRYVNEQYKRPGRGLSPTYGSRYGFTPEIHSKLRKYKYTPNTGGRTTRASGKVGEAEGLLERGEKLSNSLISTIRSMANRGSLSQKTIDRFAQMGFRF